MEVTSLCTRLWMSVLLLLVEEAQIFCDAQEVDDSVILEGPVQPVMEGDSVTLHCRNKITSSNYTAEFYKDNKFLSSSDEGTMIIDSVSKSDAGPYKCLISEVGESEKWLLAVDGVILEGPVQPVMEGDSVTFHCRKRKDPVRPIADFYRHGVRIHTSYGGQMTIPRASKADEGPYKCSISGFGESAENQLVVQDGVILEGPVQPVMEGDSVTFHCKNNKDPTRRIADFYRNGILFRTGYTGEMTIPRVSKVDEGPYKCSISGFGESAENHLIVRGGSVMLESPVFHVMEGETVTLRCRQKENLVNHAADFFKDGQKIQTDYSGEMTINRVSKADEGLYKCDISAFGESPENRLVVMNNSSLYKEERHQETQNILLIRTVFISVAVALMSLVVGLLHCGKIGNG